MRALSQSANKTLADIEIAAHATASRKVFTDGSVGSALHKLCLEALVHFYSHGNSNVLLSIRNLLPTAARKECLDAWVHKCSNLRFNPEAGGYRKGRKLSVRQAEELRELCETTPVPTPQRQPRTSHGRPAFLYLELKTLYDKAVLESVEFADGSTVAEFSRFFRGLAIPAGVKELTERKEELEAAGQRRLLRRVMEDKHDAASLVQKGVVSGGLPSLGKRAK
jgi:hypothetical protein